MGQAFNKRRIVEWTSLQKIYQIEWVRSRMLKSNNQHNGMRFIKCPEPTFSRDISSICITKGCRWLSKSPHKAPFLLGICCEFLVKTRMLFQYELQTVVPDKQDWKAFFVYKIDVCLMTIQAWDFLSSINLSSGACRIYSAWYNFLSNV